MIRRIVLFAISVLFLFYCSRQSDERQSKAAAAKVHVKTAAVRRMNLVDTVRFFGAVAWHDELQLASQFDGRLSNFHLYLGDRVRQGQQIGDIIPAQREALLQILPAIDPALRPVLQQQIKTIPLKSPLSGTVIEVYRHNGDVLQKGQPIVRIGNLQILDVLGDLPLADIEPARGQKTMRVTFLDFRHRPLTLPVAAIGGAVDVKKQTVTVRLSLPNSQQLFRPGMRVRIDFPGTVHARATVIPREALLEQEGVYSVFVVKKGRAFKRNLQIGLKQARWIEILSGVRAGETVVTQKAYSLVDGMEVVTE